MHNNVFLPLLLPCLSLCQVMNELVVDRGPHPYLCNLELFCNGRFMTSVQGDGECACMCVMSVEVRECECEGECECGCVGE